jgi:alanine transaminase
MVVINPGNPTGNVLKRQDIEDIIKICYENQIVIIADEVYQQNIYKEDMPFISFRKVLAEMGEPYRDNVELVSLHSVSKGLMGECGLRGGYFEAHNFDKYANDMIYKLKSIELCSNTIGQVAASLMVNPPTQEQVSSECFTQYNDEFMSIKNGLKERAILLTKTFNEMINTSCNEIEGAMYAFPRVHFSPVALKKAEDNGVPVDFMYCLDMVEETGIMTVPGSGFG